MDNESRKSLEQAVIKSAVDLLSAFCGTESDKIIDALTGLLWNDEEAGDIKRSDKND